MNYRQFIEARFVIDEPREGRMVPFKFNQVQNIYYDELVKLGIEDKGITVAIREFIVKARREGFSSLILAIFAADDILQENPTESQVVSYKDDATNTFRRRYRRFVLSWYAIKYGGLTFADIEKNPNLLETFKKQVFSVDTTELIIRHNMAHFYCGTAAARTGGRGGVLQKLLFSEAAHYQDTDKITSREIIDGTSQQVDKSSGWIFQESTANGIGNYFYQTYEQIKQGLSRYLLRFYGWRSFYNDEQFKVIASEFVDPDMLKQEYPETEEEAFISSNLSFTSAEKILAMVGKEANKKFVVQMEISGLNYIDQCEMILDYVNTLVKLNPGRAFYLGLDTAKHVDRTLLTILQETELVASGGVKAMAIDSTGQGDFIPDWFEKNSKWFIVRYNFSRPSKSVMYKNLQTVIEDKQTCLPEFMKGKEFSTDEWKHFYKQMVGLKKEIIGETLVVAHPKGNCTPSNHNYETCPYHDDHPDSWGLAEIAYVNVNGVPAVSRRAPPKSNFDSSVRRMLENKGAHRQQKSHEE